MINTLMTFAVVMVLALGMTACGERTPSGKAQSAGQAANDAAKATGEYLTQSKDTAVKAAQETLNGIERKWQDLHAKAAPTTDEAKTDLQKAKDQMAQTIAEAKAKLVEAKDAGADAWQRDVKPALDAALQKAYQLYEDTSAKFN